jgi:Na+-transporting methylmalonyl-CoA/oxaloacetate decarboxylase gamma subunit
MNFNLDELLLAAEHLAGFVIVMLALSLLWGLTVVLGRVVARIEKLRTLPVAVPAATIPPVGAPTGVEVSDDELVVIAATVAAMIDGRHRVVAVRPVQSSWGQQGRREIHASHRIR